MCRGSRCRPCRQLDGTELSIAGQSTTGTQRPSELVLPIQPAARRSDSLRRVLWIDGLCRLSARNVPASTKAATTNGISHVFLHISFFLPWSGPVEPEPGQSTARPWQRGFLPCTRKSRAHRRSASRPGLISLRRVAWTPGRARLDDRSGPFRTLRAGARRICRPRRPARSGSRTARRKRRPVPCPGPNGFDRGGDVLGGRVEDRLADVDSERGCGSRSASGRSRRPGCRPPAPRG